MRDDEAKNGKSEWESGSNVDEQMVPCVVHGVTTVFGQKPGERVCSACVREGLIPQPREFRPPSAADIEAERAVDAEVHAKVTVEYEREMLRRERIDFAIQRGDLGELERLGAGEAAIKEVRNRLAGQLGGVGERERAADAEGETSPFSFDEEAGGPARRVAVGESPAPPVPREPDPPARRGEPDGAVHDVPARAHEAARGVAPEGRVTDDSLEDYIFGLAEGR